MLIVGPDDYPSRDAHPLHRPMLAITALVLSSFQRADGMRKSGAVVIIGSFPITLASDLGTARQLLVLAILLLVALIVFYLVQIF